MMQRTTLISTLLVVLLLAMAFSAVPAGEMAVPTWELPAPAREPAPAKKSIPPEEPVLSDEPVPPEEPATPAQASDPGDRQSAAEVPETLRVLLPDGSVEEMELEEYLWGVVAAEVPASFDGQALMAQAVAARTYTLYQLAHPKKVHPQADICTDYACCQAWITREGRMERWPEDMGEEYAEKITAAVTDTAGEVLIWQGEPALTVFHASSAGRTRSAQAVWGEEVPYLISVESPESGEDEPNYYSVVSVAAEEFSARLLAQYPNADLSGEPEEWFGPVREDDSGAPAVFTVGGVEMTAQQLRSLFELRSATFEVECAPDEITFYVTGYGHGVGMSQYGANAMAAEGADYREILAHYYPGTELEGARQDGA